jgi:hypothetical protein
MAQAHNMALLEKVLLQFITEMDPILAMLEWVAHQMMLIEAEGAFWRRDSLRQISPHPKPLLDTT